MSEKGFTLLEIMLVLALLSLVLLIAVPSLIPLVEHHELTKTINQFFSDYRLAQITARASSRWVAIQIVPTEHFYIIKDINGIIKKVDYGKNISVTSTYTAKYNTITFNIYGWVDQGGRITFTNSRNETHSCIIQVVTGQIRVE